jgi:hypothetical protein
MTIPPAGTTGTVMDPATGATYPAGVAHQSKFGYLLSVQYPIAMKKLDRAERFGWEVSPGMSYANQFGTSEIPAVTSLNLAVAISFL